MSDTNKKRQFLRAVLVLTRLQGNGSRRCTYPVGGGTLDQVIVHRDVVRDVTHQKLVFLVQRFAGCDCE